MLKNVKMPTIISILTLINSLIDTTSESLKAKKDSSFHCILAFYEQLNLIEQLSMKQVL